MKSDTSGVPQCFPLLDPNVPEGGSRYPDKGCYRVGCPIHGGPADSEPPAAGGAPREASDLGGAAAGIEPATSGYEGPRHALCVSRDAEGSNLSADERPSTANRLPLPHTARSDYASAARGVTALPICGNCDTEVPPGCSGLFKDDGTACALNRALGVGPTEPQQEK